MKLWCYDTDVSFEANLRRGVQAPRLSTPISIQIPTHFAGKTLSAPLGVAACPATAAQGIRVLSQLGYGYFTYKTLRSQKHFAYSEPNIFPLSGTPRMHSDFLDKPLDVSVSGQMTHTLANSLGNPSMHVAWHMDDIELAKSYLNDSQCLTISCYGEGSTLAYTKQDWCRVIAMVKEVQADCIELNLSCPNLGDQHQLFYFSDSDFLEVLDLILKTAAGIPILVKLPFVQDEVFLLKRLKQLAYSDVYGITATNTVPMQLVRQGAPLFGQARKRCGLSGDVIYPISQQYILKLLQLRADYHLDLKLVACGGVNYPHRIQALLNQGADLVTSATAVLKDPTWALNYFKEYVDEYASTFAAVSARN